MRTRDFEYELPPDRIAQRPVEPRDSSRLLVLDRATGTIAHRQFTDLPDYLRPGDLVVVNVSRVLQARIPAVKIESGGAVQLLLVRRVEPQVWEVLAGGRGLRVGVRLRLVDGSSAEVIDALGGARRLVRFDRSVTPRLAQIGQVPLPPYIRQPLADSERYQTMFGTDLGSIAAPTAGLHFTPGLVGRLAAAGVQFAEVTLHIGLDTFAPVKVEEPERHSLHSEWCQVSETVAEQVHRIRAQGGRVLAVGTTCVRALESAAALTPPGEALGSFEGPTRLFILPGFKFRTVDALITNFHLPRSTLLMLVAAFAGRERVLAAYQIGVTAGYRFYSFGDAMLIL